MSGGSCRYTRRKTVTKRKNGSHIDLGSSKFWSRTEDLQRGRVRSLASYYENSDSEVLIVWLEDILAVDHFILCFFDS